jgi:DNA-binding transcriptional ArsR family regulator
MYLEKILGSKSKIRMLNVLLTGNRFIESELAKKARLSAPEVSRQIFDLIGIGLVHINKVGRSKEYSINNKHFLFKTLKKLFTDLSGIYFKAAEKVVKFLVNKYKIDCVLLIGGVAEKRANEESDIDFIILLPEKEIGEAKKR